MRIKAIRGMFGVDWERWDMQDLRNWWIWDIRDGWMFYGDVGYLQGMLF